ncbi:heavy-metal-associated domain-containing protein [Mesobacillus zeae]|uniref:heavy-metal-associated domain-containing protein n=1 Tax=Mesobacillus zeae TaxID=1917180 RepID=UPI001AE89C57
MNTINIAGMTCAHCETTVESSLMEVEGVAAVTDLTAGRYRNSRVRSAKGICKPVRQRG